MPYDVVKLLVRAGEDVRLGVTRREVTILFCGIRNFKDIAAVVTPEQLLVLLQTYFTIVADVIDVMEGTLLEFIDDGILAVWNAPVTIRRHSRKCVRAAVEIRERMMMEAALDVEWQSAMNDAQIDRLSLMIGVHTANMLCGNIGSPSRLKYASSNIF